MMADMRSNGEEEEDDMVFTFKKKKKKISLSLSVNRRFLVRCGVGERETLMREKVQWRTKKKRRDFINTIFFFFLIFVMVKFIRGAHQTRPVKLTYRVLILTMV